MILFQDNILKLIDSFTIDTLPHSILIKGDVGSGKHMIASYISEKFNLEYVNITDNINLDTINDIYLSNQLTAYVIEIDKLSIKEQNTILKLLEEPSITAFLLLLSSNNMVLTTVENRCYKIKLNTYTKDQLSNFIFDNVDLILSIAKTPGQALDLQGEDIAGMYELANKIFQHVRTSNFSNVLSISNRFKFDEIIYWSELDGPVRSEFKPDKQKINGYLDAEHPDMDAAGNAIRRYLEEFLNKLSKNIQESS